MRYDLWVARNDLYAAITEMHSKTSAIKPPKKRNEQFSGGGGGLDRGGLFSAMPGEPRGSAKSDGLREDMEDDDGEGGRDGDDEDEQRMRPAAKATFAPSGKGASRSNITGTRDSRARASSQDSSITELVKAVMGSASSSVAPIPAPAASEMASISMRTARAQMFSAQFAALTAAQNLGVDLGDHGKELLSSMLKSMTDDAMKDN